MLDYNTQRPDMKLKEYGRNVQMLVKHLHTVEDKETRTQMAYTVVDLIKQLSNGPKDVNQENMQKYWDDLFIMSNFDLDVESPYPMPAKDILGRKPERVKYTTNEVKFKHYGRNVELLVEKAIALEEGEEKNAAILYIGRLMKTFYSTWNRDNVTEEAVADNIKQLSEGRLSVDIKEVKENNAFDVIYKDTSRPRPVSSNHKGKKQNYKKRRN
ncbi:DUF4290 domain-containing protein [Marivirga sp. S37H4]|uniref:DUF4290 domain-containing protein n=1 Tax=Marivirga aurantiaca TaxID=2802615 RepID=A0A934WVR6_9BACT|nr:DUF4290 domain-containing protein [Marivirga aurantiaca]MBK6263939.1 DUF4290 domain-containing protein [Marivirga aurantiaca]